MAIVARLRLDKPYAPIVERSLIEPPQCSWTSRVPPALPRTNSPRPADGRPIKYPEKPLLHYQLYPALRVFSPASRRRPGPGSIALRMFAECSARSLLRAKPGHARSARRAVRPRRAPCRRKIWGEARSRQCRTSESGRTARARLSSSPVSRGGSGPALRPPGTRVPPRPRVKFVVIVRRKFRTSCRLNPPRRGESDGLSIAVGSNATIFK